MRRISVFCILFISIGFSNSQSIIEIADEMSSQHRVGEVNNIRLPLFNLLSSSAINQELRYCVNKISQESNHDTFILSFGLKNDSTYLMIQDWSLWGIVDNKNLNDNLFGVIKTNFNDRLKYFFLINYGGDNTKGLILRYIKSENCELTFKRKYKEHDKENYICLDKDMTTLIAFISPQFDIREFIINGNRIK